MRLLVIRTISIFMVCLGIHNAFGVIKKPVIDGQVDLTLHDKLVTIVCTLSDDYCTILNTITKKRVGIDMEAAFHELCKEMPELCNKITKIIESA